MSAPDVVDKPLNDAQGAAVAALLEVSLNVAARANRKPALTTLLAADRKKAIAAAATLGGDVSIAQAVQRLLRQGTNGVTFGGPVTPTYGTTRRATNVTSIAYYHPGQNFLNIIRDAGATWYDPDLAPNTPSPYVSSTFWPTNVPAGKRLRLFVKGDMSPYAGYFKPGQYRVTCSNSNFTIRLVNRSNGFYASGTSNVLYTFAAGVIEGDGVFVELYNGSGTSQSVTPGRDGLVMRHTDYDALWAAGEIWDPDLLASLTGECFVRFMDSTGGIGGVENATDIAANEPTFLMGLWPPEVCASLCKKLGCGAWYCMPYIRDSLCWESNAAANTFRLRQDYGDTLYVTPPCTEGQKIFLSTWYGTVEAFSGMDAGPWYAKNVTSTTFQISATPGGAAIDLTADNTGASHLRGFTRDADQLTFWKGQIQRFYNAYPLCPEFHPETLNEGWNFGFHSYGFTQSVLQYQMSVASRAGPDTWQEAWGRLQAYLWSFVETYYSRGVSRRTFTSFSYNCGGYENGIRYTMPTGTPYAGQTVISLMDEFAIATYTPDVLWKDAYDAGFHTMTNAQRDTYCAIDMTNMRVNAIGNWFTKLAEWGRSGANAPKFTTYETQQSFKGQRSPYGVGIEPYPGVPATTSASLTEDAVLAYFFGSGGVNWRAAMLTLHTDFACDAYNQYTNRGIIGYRGEYVHHWGEVDRPGQTNAYRTWRLASFRPLGA